jgi:ectoine hydroxylase-related dioxygenase (phytanoyl-CoA dioxygenase family)
MVRSESERYFDTQKIRVEDLDEICSKQTRAADFPIAETVEQNALIYEGDVFRQAVADGTEVALKTELCRALKDGPGIFVVKDAYVDVSVVDRCTEIFTQVIAEEKAAGQGQGDHFGNNVRIWNSVQKVCAEDPEVFIDYFLSPVLAIACEAWLGPFYQVTGQVNNVKPGSAAQSVHRDYHLGFQSAETVARFPAHAQVMSQYLTLQGAVAHGDMPEESGPTLLLPYSHQYAAGYLAHKRPEFQAYFEVHCTQMPLGKGDMIFFTPAVFHGAGANRSASDRIANLFQISSAFGRTMETIDNGVMVEAVYPVLLARAQAGTITEREVSDVISVAADGYSFPTNLDLDPPVDGNAPETGQQLVWRALGERWSPEELYARMSAYGQRRKA